MVVWGDVPCQTWGRGYQSFPRFRPLLLKGLRTEAKVDSREPGLTPGTHWEPSAPHPGHFSRRKPGPKHTGRQTLVHRTSTSEEGSRANAREEGSCVVNTLGRGVFALPFPNIPASPPTPWLCMVAPKRAVKQAGATRSPS